MTVGGFFKDPGRRTKTVLAILAIVALIALGTLLAVVTGGTHPSHGGETITATEIPPPILRQLFRAQTATDLTVFRGFIAEIEATTFYQKWAAQNPGEVARWQAYRDSILAGQPTAAPTMTTHFGRALVLAGTMATTAPAVTVTVTVTTTVTSPATTTTTAPTTTTTATSTSSSTTTAATSTTTTAASVYDRPVPRYGVSPGFNALNRTPAMEGFELNQMIRVGAKLVRLDYLPGWYTQSDAAITQAINAGLEPELVLGATVKYPWSKTAAQYGADCSYAATKWRGKVRYYEPMNEENSNGWTGAAYEPYLAACYDAIKAVDPRNIVLIGGINPATQGTQSITWLSDVYAAGGKSKFDVMNVHPYGDPAIVATWSLWCKTFGCNGTIFPAIIDVMKANGDGSKPIIATEGGDRASIGEQVQASTVSKFLADGRLAQAYVYNMLADPAVDFGLEVQDSAGSIVAPDGSHWRRRPAFAAAMAVMGGTG